MGGETVGILRKFGRLTTVITDKTANATVADFDLAPNFYPALSSLRRLNMPCWACDAMASPS